MNETNIQAKFVLCILHDNPSVIQKLCFRFSGYEYDEEYSNKGHDECMINAFELSGNVCQTLTKEDLQSIAKHRDVTYVLSPPLIAEKAMEEADRALKFVDLCFDLGAQAVKCESSGIAHGKDFWKKLASSDDDGLLYWTWVRRPLNDNGVIYSCGMHLLGYPDIEIYGETVLDALKLIDGFAMYIIIDQPGESLRSGHTFSLSSDSPSYKVTKKNCIRYEEDEFFYNPLGYWHLEKV
ncbi:MAG: hypothetical protein GY714_31945 [Desulfobacterales bacterium]|nr:hypothetical protein [Desulfobacterales bacterium]